MAKFSDERLLGTPLTPMQSLPPDRDMWTVKLSPESQQTICRILYGVSAYRSVNLSSYGKRWPATYRAYLEFCNMIGVTPEPAPAGYEFPKEVDK